MSTDRDAEFDAQAVRAKYLAERDKRLIPGRADTVDVRHDERFARYRVDPFTPVAKRDPVTDDVDVVIVGGGIAGVLAGVELRKAGIGRLRIIDQAGGIGGTWYWNRYPAVMCDVESYMYMPMLEEMGHIPTERYASGDEIRRHLQAIADRYDLVADALFHTGVDRAEWDEDGARWIVSTDRGDRISCRYYVLAVGILNLMKLPAIPGIESFLGHSFHTSRWDYTYTGGGPGRPMTELADKVVGLIGTGATGIQCLQPLAEAAKKVIVFQRTPSAVGVRGNGPTPPDFSTTLGPGWQKARMDNFQAVMLGQPVDDDLVADGWTRHYAAVSNPPRREGMSMEEFARASELIDFEIMEEHRTRVESIVSDAAKAEALKPYYRYRCKRPCFHDEYLSAFNHPNVDLVDCPGGFDRISERGPVIDGTEYAVDCLVFGTGFEAELTPLPRRAGHDIVGRGGLTLAEKFAGGSSTLFGMMSRGFPNLFVMPAPGQQAVVTVNYTQLAVLGAEFVGGAVALLDKRGDDHGGESVFDVSADAEDAWVQTILDSYIDGSAFMALCTPSRLNNEGNPQSMNPRNGNYGRGFGDWFGYRDLLEGWLGAGTFEGLELETHDGSR